MVSTRKDDSFPQPTKKLFNQRRLAEKFRLKIRVEYSSDSRVVATRLKVLFWLPGNTRSEATVTLCTCRRSGSFLAWFDSSRCPLCNLNALALHRYFYLHATVAVACAAVCCMRAPVFALRFPIYAAEFCALFLSRHTYSNFAVNLQL